MKWSLRFSSVPFSRSVVSDSLRPHESQHAMEDLDFESRKITISRSMEFRYGYQEFKIGEPKSKHGYRTIPMTQTTYDILKRKAS